MSNLFNPICILLTASALVATADNYVERPVIFWAQSLPTVQSTDGALLSELNLLCTKQLRASGMAGKQGGPQIRNWGSKLSVILSDFSAELKVLAKKRSVELPGTLPQGGERPDGRVDASPENMKDTSRLSNAGGEAGNTGIVKTKPAGLNDAANNALTESLSKLKGKEFDNAYRNLLISDKPLAEELLIKASLSKDNGISAFAKKYLAKLRAVQI